MIKQKAGAVIRKKEEGKTQILLLHNLPRDRWLLPKGHMEEGETHEQTAIREIKEETGLEVALIGYLAEMVYEDDQKNEVHLKLYLAEATGGKIVPEDEEHELVWLPLIDAIKRFSYDNIRECISANINSIEQL